MAWDGNANPSLQELETNPHFWPRDQRRPPEAADQRPPRQPEGRIRPRERRERPHVAESGGRARPGHVRLPPVVPEPRRHGRRHEPEVLPGGHVAEHIGPVSEEHWPVHPDHDDREHWPLHPDHPNYVGPSDGQPPPSRWPMQPDRVGQGSTQPPSAVHPGKDARAHWPMHPNHPSQATHPGQDGRTHWPMQPNHPSQATHPGQDGRTHWPMQPDHPSQATHPSQEGRTHWPMQPDHPSQATHPSQEGRTHRPMQPDHPSQDGRTHGSMRPDHPSQGGQGSAQPPHRHKKHKHKPHTVPVPIPPRQKPSRQTVRPDHERPSRDHDLMYPSPGRTRPFTWFVAVFCVILWLAIILGGILVLIIYLVFRPRNPHFEIPNASLNAAYMDMGYLLNADLTVLANFTNPNQKMSVDFNFAVLKLRYENNPIAIQYIEPFLVEKTENKLTSVEMVSSQIRLPILLTQQLIKQIQNNRITFHVDGQFHVRSRLGSLFRYSYMLYTRCTIVTSGPPSGILLASKCITKR